MKDLKTSNVLEGTTLWNYYRVGSDDKKIDINMLPRILQNTETAEILEKLEHEIS